MRKRNNQITLWLNDDELRKLDQIVEHLPYSRQRYIREVILGADVYVSPPVEYGAIIKELRAIGNNVHQLLLKAIQLKFIDEVMITELYKTVLDMDGKFTAAFTSKRYRKKVSELWQ